VIEAEELSLVHLDCLSSRVALFTVFPDLVPSVSAKERVDGFLLIIQV